VGLGGKTNGVERDTGFVITAASEVMAVLALAGSRADLRRRLENIVVGFTGGGAEVRAADLRAVGAMMALLHEAVAPNLVQTTEGAPAIIHCGPFANIAHGTSSVIAQRIGLNTAEYVINESGFAADLGAEKYFDIVMRASGIRPAAVVLIASVRALAAQGAGDEKAPVTLPALRAGLANLGRHLDNLAKFGAPVVVAINKFYADTAEQIAVIDGYCRERGVPAALSDVFARGGAGGIALAEAVGEAADRPADPRPLYPAELPLRDKIERLAAEIYGAAAVEFSPEAAAKLDRFTALGHGTLPVCVAKTQYSISDNPKLYGAPSGYTFRVTDAHLSAGAGFVVAIAGNMMRMPGLGKAPQAMQVDVREDGEIVL
jgi:formate--tetrahydrofolate ligase